MNVPHPFERLEFPSQTRDEKYAQSERILLWTAGRIIKAAEPGWERIEVNVLGSGTDFDVKYTILDADGSSGIGDLPPEIMRAFDDMRILRYEEGVGTWLSLRMYIKAPDFLDATFNVWVDPIWDPSISAAAYENDLRHYPRTDEYIPRWLKAKLNTKTPLPPVKPGEDPPMESYVELIETQTNISLPPGWTYAQIHFREVGNHREINGLMQDISGKMTPWTPPVEVADRFSEYRAATRSRPAVWFSARLEVWYTGKYNFDMYGTTEPKWANQPSVDDFREEVRLAGLYSVPLPDWIISGAS
ncbi:hypothetical protein [Nocardia lasii]|uniref:DUF1838 domain-containing protein n=1 Tax=Nocardia lasii TaxID=1616107 RepID=A0ABW1JQD7_9NOCA